MKEHKNQLERAVKDQILGNLSSKINNNNEL